MNTFWFKTDKRSATCPYCHKTYHFVEDVVAVSIIQDGCGCDESHRTPIEGSGATRDECGEDRLEGAQQVSHVPP